MSEAEGKVKIEYELEGIDESTSAQERLEASLTDVQRVLDESAESIGAYEQAQAGAAESSDSLTASAVEQGFKMAELRERVGQAVGAIGTLSSILGVESDAGAVLGRMSQFGQLGTQVGGVFGPGGAVVGAIVGALIPALDQLVTTTDESAEAMRVASAEADNLALSTANAATSARNLARAQLEARSQAALATDEIGVRLASEDALLTARDSARQRVLDAQRTLATITRNNDARDLRGEVEIYEQRIADAQRELQVTSGEIERRAAEARAASGAGTGDSGGGAGGGGAGGRGRGGRGGAAAVDPTFTTAEETRLSEFRMGLIEEQEARELARIERIREEEQRSLDMRKEAADIANREAEENARKLLEEQARAAEQQMQREESKRLAIKRDQERDTRMWRGTQESMLDATLGGANAIGGAFADAFGAAIQGQEDFGTAFVKGAKMQLLQFGIGQVAEGAGALLSAVGFLFTNPPAAAGKAAEGAGKIALGVSLGAAGAAISVPAPAAGGEDRAPRMGPSSTESGGGGNVIVNMNAPSVTAATEAQLGRSLSRTISGSARRFGRAA